MTRSCDCCVGTHVITPQPVTNRPGLSRIRTRIGTHGSFLETMLARLSSADYPALHALTTRDPADASIALLDSWAVVADVLTFYQERIANEAYLRTATERRSLLELARLIGYVPKPGVAASVWLAFGLEKESAPVEIPKGSRANSIPGPGETMEAFETSEAIKARLEWSRIKPRLVQPQTSTTIEDGLYLKGSNLKLKADDYLLLKMSATAQLEARRIASVEVDHANDKTRIVLRGTASGTPAGTNAAAAVKGAGAPASTATSVNAVPLAPLLIAQTVAPASAVQLNRSTATSFAARADALPQLLTGFKPGLADNLYKALANTPPQEPQPIEVYVLRVDARLFGHNAPLQLAAVGNEKTPPEFKEWTTGKPWGDGDNAGARFHKLGDFYLDNDYEISPDSKLVIVTPEEGVFIFPRLSAINHVSLNAYGLSGKSAEILWDPKDQNGSTGKASEGGETPPAAAAKLVANATKNGNQSLDDFTLVRSLRILTGSEQLELADAPMPQALEGDTIELDGLYDGLDPGRWLIIEGERADVVDANNAVIPGLRVAELVMLAGVEQKVRVADTPAPAPPPRPNNDKTDAAIAESAKGAAVSGSSGDNGSPPASLPLPGDTIHTTLTLAAQSASGSGLAYKYKRDTVTIYANVAKATHGETRGEVLGSGNAAQALQQFLLKQGPLTYVSAQTPSGIASTLEVRVNDVLWHEAVSLAELGAQDRKFLTRTDDADKVGVIFGNGKRGQRLPTGRENVKALYRSGIGKPGNVKAGQISLLASRPLGVKDVINPVRASGGAGREEAAAIRKNAPTALFALDRLLSTSDYADFARSFGGIGKAAAARESDGRRSLVNVVIAGVDDAPIDATSDVFRNLKAALQRFGDPQVPVRLAVRERLALVMSVGVRIDPDYLWEAVEPKIRAAMLDVFSFDHAELGVPLFLATAMRTIQAIKGVTYADIDVFDSLSEGQLLAGFDKALAPGLCAQQRISVKPNQLAWLTPDVPDTLILQEIKS